MVIVTVPLINCPSGCVQLQILTGALRCNIAGSKLQHALEIAVPLRPASGMVHILSMFIVQELERKVVFALLRNSQATGGQIVDTT